MNKIKTRSSASVSMAVSVCEVGKWVWMKTLPGTNLVTNHINGHYRPTARGGNKIQKNTSIILYKNHYYVGLNENFARHQPGDQPTT